VEKVLNDVKRAFINHGQFVLANDESDIYDADNPYRGVNLEFRYIGLFTEETGADYG
jgi:hypothetical protein